MKPIFKSIALTLSAVSLAACGGSGAETPAELIVGEWVQTTPITISDSGATIQISNSMNTYRADGTTEGTASMTIQPVPVGVGGFEISAAGDWRLEDGILVEDLTDMDVKASGSNPQAFALAAQMQVGMQNQGESRSEIRELTKDSLVLYAPATDIEIRYTRK